MFDPDNEHYSSLAIPISELEDLFNHKLAGTFPPNIWSLEGRIAYVLFGAHEHHELDHPERPLVSRAWNKLCVRKLTCLRRVSASNTYPG